MKAVILAAGRGSRLGKYTSDRPKTLVEVGGKAMLQRSMDNLLKSGFEHVTLVLGYRHEMIEEHLAARFPKDFYDVLLNPDYTRGSGSSLMCALPALQGDLVIVESDLLYDYRVLGRMAAPKVNNAMAMGNFNHGRREVKLYLDGDKIGRAAWAEPDDTEANGDWVGFTRLCTETSDSLRRMIEATDPDQGKEIHYEAFIFELLKQYRFQAIYIQDLPWIEIDNAEDYERAQREVCPAIDGFLKVGSVA